MGILTVITSLLGIGGDFLAKRQRLKEVEIEGQTRIAIARAEAEVARLNKAMDAEIDWDSQAVSQMQGSWKDEYLTILLSVPMILAFLGDWGRDAVSQGFAAITNAPDWYKVAFLSAIAASFGIRALVNRFGLGGR